MFANITRLYCCSSEIHHVILIHILSIPRGITIYIYIYILAVHDPALLGC